MNLPWFRMYARFVTDPVVEELSFEDQRHFVFLLCLKCDGLLDKGFPNSEMRERAIARRLGLQGEALISAKARLVESGLIDDHWQPKSWDDLQFKSDSSAERQRRYREKNRKRNGDVTVTAQDQDPEQIRKDRRGQKALSEEEQARNRERLATLREAASGKLRAMP
ncbi:MAG: hypothetical protein ACT443_15810 [Gemmatimonadota bacterium]